MMWLSYICMFLLLVVGVLLIFIVLLQRGRGGGLAGALGGMGGQSAFGTKAGDFFTRVTVVLAVIWIVLGAGQIPLLRAVGTARFKGGSGAPAQLTAPALDGAKAGGSKEPMDDETPIIPDEPAAEKAKPDADLKSEQKTDDADTEKKPAAESKKEDEPKSEPESKSDGKKPSQEEKKSDTDKPSEESKPESKSDSDK